MSMQATHAESTGINGSFRRMKFSDMSRVAYIEGLSFNEPWTVGEYMSFMSSEGSVAQVYICDSLVVGTVCYTLIPSSPMAISRSDRGSLVQLVSIAVDPDWRRQGVGRQIVDRLADKSCYPGEKKLVFIEVRESSLQSQVFFRECGMLATGTLPSYCNDTGEDAYVMTIPLEEKQ